LPTGWWADDPYDSDYQAERVKGWKRIDQIAFGWAVLWKCPSCGQLWEGIVRGDYAHGTTDCVEKYYGTEDDWFVKRKADYDRFVSEERVIKKVNQTATEYERAGYKVDYSPLFAPPWSVHGRIVEWRYTLFCKKKRLLGGYEYKKRLDFILDANGDVQVKVTEL